MWDNNYYCSARKSLLHYSILDTGHSETQFYCGILRMLWMLTREPSKCSLSSLEVGFGRRDREHLLKGFSMLSLLWKHVFDSRCLGNVSISRWPRNAFEGVLCRIRLYWPNPIFRLSGGTLKYVNSGWLTPAGTHNSFPTSCNGAHVGDLEPCTVAKLLITYRSYNNLPVISVAYLLCCKICDNRRRL
jgi:hypothetical protein